MSVGSVDVCLPMGGGVRVCACSSGAGLNWVGAAWDTRTRQVILFSCETSQPFIRVIRGRYPGARHAEKMAFTLRSVQEIMIYCSGDDSASRL
ncbi:MAG: hypothetical protein WCE94_02945 [Candidatus Methanoperedens sp.]